MVRQLNGIWRLTRFPEFVSFVVITTLLGAAAANGTFGWPLVIVLCANLLAVGFAFMINDVEDAPDDALTPEKAQRNPISAGDLSPQAGRRLSFLAAGLAAVLYALLGLGPFLAGMATLVIAYLYSWRRIRLKAMPIVDMLSHAAMLAGLQFAAAYLVFEGDETWRWVFPLSMALAISLYGELFNELRDFEGDAQAGLNHTASFIGPRAARGLMMACLAVGVFSGFITFFVVRLFPWWVLALAGVVALLLTGERLTRKGATQTTIALHQAFQKPVEIGAALAMLAWFVSPFVVGVV